MVYTIEHRGQEGRQGATGQRQYSRLPPNNGLDGRDGLDGLPGGKGSQGEDAGKVTIDISSNGNQLVVNGKKTGEIIGSNNCSIAIYVEGGKGGRGGRGGEGERGTRGLKGFDARQGKQGTKGGSGGNGGNGGEGGDGGDGGNGGEVIIQISERETDLLYLISQISVAGGEGGEPGKGGEGGSLGFGGEGGNAFYGGNGIHGEDGGLTGHHGASGKDGPSGMSGNQGRDGHYYFFVNEQKKMFQRPFNLVINSVRPLISNDSIIEPGEIFSTQITVINDSEMSTPTLYSAFTLSLFDNPYIIQDTISNTFEYNQVIGGLQSVTIPKEFVFKIAPQLVPKVNTPFSETFNLKFNAILNRVKAEFKGITSFNLPVKIEYPVELTYISGLRSFLDDEEIPFVIGIKNKSSKPLGIKNGRLLNMRVYSESKPGAVQFIPYSTDEDKINQQNNSEQIAQKALDQSNFIRPDEKVKNYQLLKQVFIPSINAGETIYFKGTLKVIDQTMLAYDSMNIRFFLDIGHIDDQTNKYQTIQENIFKIQKSDRLQFRDTSDVLLLINSEVESNAIFKVRQSLQAVGADCDIYNMTQFQNFDYHFDPLIKNPSLHKKKVVAIFANSFKDHENKETNAIKLIGIDNIYKSSYEDDTRNYIMGSSKDIKYGRIFNYPALYLYRNSYGHLSKPTFHYQRNIKITIPDLAITYAEYLENFEKVRQEDDHDDNGEAVEAIQAKLPADYQVFYGIQQHCSLLYKGDDQRQLKNIKEVTDFYKKNPNVIESVQNLETSFRHRVRIEEYLNSTFDTKNIIVKQIAQVHEALSKYDPSYQYHTRHYYFSDDKSDPSLLEKYIGKAFKSSGYQYIVRGLKKDCAQIAFREKGESANIDDGDIYNIFKMIPVEKKVGYINKINSNDDKIVDLLFAAIGSDLCNEFKAFTAVGSRSDWNIPQYLENMKGWNALNKLNLDRLVSNKNVYVLKKILVMINSVISAISDQVGFFVKLCCCSCFSNASATVLTTCTNVQQKLSQKISECPEASDNVSGLVSKKFQKAKNKLEAIQRPDIFLTKGTTFYNNQSTCIVHAFDLVPAWIKQELLRIQNQQGQHEEKIQIVVSNQKKVYSSDQERKNDIIKYVQQLNKLIS